jgi:pyruvate dehydrogenase E2 component (dihydrolipoamide acetyltransferase)
MESGTVLEWKVRPGDTVHRGDVVAVVDTEKSDIDVEVFEDGVIEELLVEVGREVEVGTPLARIAPAGETAAREPATTKPAEAAPTETKPSATRRRTPKRAAPRSARPQSRPRHVDGGHVRASPLARRTAAERGLDLGSIPGSGPDGAVLADDVPGAVVTPPPSTEESPGRRKADRDAAMRHAIGELMARSKREIPHYYVATTIDLSTATAWSTAQNAARSVAERLVPAALLLKATALALRDVPNLNGFWEDGHRRPSTAIHLGVAVSLRGGGLVAPAIHDADRLPIDDLMAALRDLVERARAGRLRSSEMSDPTITVTSLGDNGAEEVYGVIYPPQVALVGFGRITERPWASDGMVGARPTVRATLSADHRATDGHEGSRLLVAIDHLLQRPEDL